MAESPTKPASKPSPGANRLPWPWNTSCELAANLVADDDMSDKEIAQRVGIAKATLERWKQVPEFGARVLENREQIRKAQLSRAVKYGVAIAEERMRVLNEVWERSERLIRDRAKELADVPGGRTGLLTRRIKTIRISKPVKVKKKVGRKVIENTVYVDVNKVVEEYRADCALVGKVVEVAEQAAKQMGEWIEKHQNVDDDYDGSLKDWSLEEIAAAKAVHQMRKARFEREAREKLAADASKK